MASATVSAFSAPHSLLVPIRPRTIPTPSPKITFPFRNLHLQSHSVSNSFTVKENKKKQFLRIVRSVEEETLIPEEQQQKEEEAPSSSSSEQTPVSVPVSPSDTLTMFFQAEGTMNEGSIPAVSKALEEAEGITNLKVQIVEGIASVELTKQTTVQATGVASSLVETIQGSGFKLQTLNLSFEDEEEVVA